MYWSAGDRQSTLTCTVTSGSRPSHFNLLLHDLPLSLCLGKKSRMGGDDWALESTRGVCFKHCGLCDKVRTLLWIGAVGSKKEQRRWHLPPLDFFCISLPPTPTVCVPQGVYGDQRTTFKNLLSLSMMGPSRHETRFFRMGGKCFCPLNHFTCPDCPTGNQHTDFKSSIV